MHIDFPFFVNSAGTAATVDNAGYVHDLLEQVLFTQRGERVHRSNFGCGVEQLVFQPNSVSLAAAVQMTIQADLQRWLSDVAEFQNIAVQPDDAKLRIGIDYCLPTPGSTNHVEFERGREA